LKLTSSTSWLKPTAIGFASVYTARQNQISSTSLVYAGFFLALFAVAHIGVRAGLPNADPWLLPLAALLSGLGLTDTGLSHLKGLTRLRELDLTGTRVSARGAAELRRALPRCRACRA